MSIKTGLEYIGAIDPWTDEERLTDEEIVRCRDCRNFEVIDGWFKWCSFHNMDVKERDFCSKGERREGC